MFMNPRYDWSLGDFAYGLVAGLGWFFGGAFLAVFAGADFLIVVVNAATALPFWIVCLCGIMWLCLCRHMSLLAGIVFCVAVQWLIWQPTWNSFLRNAWLGGHSQSTLGELLYPVLISAAFYCGVFFILFFLAVYAAVRRW